MSVSPWTCLRYWPLAGGERRGADEKRNRDVTGVGKSFATFGDLPRTSGHHLGHIIALDLGMYAIESPHRSTRIITRWPFRPDATPGSGLTAACSRQRPAR